jgi:LPXTG-site transpeptidase (sortase) family protein
MKLIIPSKKLLLISGVAILSFILIIAFFDLKTKKPNYYLNSVLPINSQGNNINEIPETVETTKNVEKKKDVPSLGARLLIPKLKINTTLGEVGLTPQAAVGTPKEPWRPAWFNLGPLPGDAGSSVIVGHSGIWENGQKTIFNNLSNLLAGDKIYIKDEKDETKVFIVQKLLSYNQDDDAPEVFYSEDNKSHLNLITCDGIWDSVSKSYPKRLVVFADRE